MVVGLIAANVAVFLLWRSADPRFMANNFMVSSGYIAVFSLYSIFESFIFDLNFFHLLYLLDVC